MEESASGGSRSTRAFECLQETGCRKQNGSEDEQLAMHPQGIILAFQSQSASSEQGE